RLSQSKTSGGLKVMGLERLRVLENLAYCCKEMRAYEDKVSGASAWELDTGNLRFTLVMSPEVWRGFSGEGQVLHDLSRDHYKKALAKVKAALKWQSNIDIRALSRSLPGGPKSLNSALSALGSQGLVGFDLNAGAYFHRELPFDMTMVEQLHPRLS